MRHERKVDLDTNNYQEVLMSAVCFRASLTTVSSMGTRKFLMKVKVNEFTERQESLLCTFLALLMMRLGCNFWCRFFVKTSI